ncbi:hypothetical protein AK812_SmicGene39386 [Symbiodinium microadriaticum]|uniref:Uncharacterized protein n=1 Tax=Symbiodinium microadriaticum TaxID=2951 RepID=A0A1Q9CBC4_SYMMI|nr:hypothetical protein AK812_SmicGene39386 [Symbiodinium microadriaticum]
MGDRPQLGPDQVALEALAVGTQDELCRPCVDCGLYTGCYCDGNDWGECFAADRLPQEHWANNQRTPLCTSCDRRFNMCHFCRGYVDLTAEDDPRGHDDEIFWEATHRAGGLFARETRSPLHPKAKPPPTPAQIAAQTRREFSARAAGYQAGSGRPKAKAAPDAAFRAAERDLIALLGAAPLDDDPIEEPSPSVRDEIEDFS